MIYTMSGNDKMSKIAFVAYYFYDEDGVASLRSRALSQLLEERGNKLDIVTKRSFGQKALHSKLLWNYRLFSYLIKNDFDKLYVSSGPFWHLPVILAACLLRKKRFIVDFRDPWSPNLRSGFGGSKPVAPEKIIKKAVVWEKLIYKYCQQFWTVTDGMRDAYKQVFNEDTKITVVINGHNIDIEKIDKNKSGKVNEKLTYVCLGKFAEYGKKRAELALAKLKSENEAINQDYVLEFIGSNEDIMRPIVNRLGMEHNVEFIPRMPYDEAIQRAASADIGISLLRDDNLEHGTKIFDYIGLGLPTFDSFQEGSHFQKFFAPYLTTTEKKIIPLDVRQRFHRKNIFQSYVEQIEN